MGNYTSFEVTDPGSIVLRNETEEERERLNKLSYRDKMKELNRRYNDEKRKRKEEDTERDRNRKEEDDRIRRERKETDVKYERAKTDIEEEEARRKRATTKRKELRDIKERIINTELKRKERVRFASFSGKRKERSRAVSPVKEKKDLNLR